MVTKLSEHVWWIDLVGVNAYLVDDDGVLTLVGAGFPWDGNRITAAITAVGDTVDDLERVLITHYDIDHVGGLARLDDLDATVYVGRPDVPHLLRDENPPVTSQKGLFQRAVDWWRDVPTLPIEPVDDGDTIGSFTAYHTPGHTPGHTIFASESLSVAFLGDLVRESGGELVPTPWFICADYDRNLETIGSVVDRLPPFEIACPGHGTPFVESGTERLSACAEQLDGTYTGRRND